MMAMNSQETTALDRTFHALGDPTRRAILVRLARGPATVGELAGPEGPGRGLPDPQPARRQEPSLPAASGKPGRRTRLARLPAPLLEREPGSTGCPSQNPPHGAKRMNTNPNV